MHKKEHLSETAHEKTEIIEEEKTESTEQGENKAKHQSFKKLSDLLARCWKSCKSVHPGWILSGILAIILLITIICSDSEDHHMGKRQNLMQDRSMEMRHQSYHGEQYNRPINDSFEIIRYDMEAMERRHQNMMNQFFLQGPQPSNIPSQTINGHYSGYRDTNGSFIRYEINHNGNTFRGNITTSSGTTTNTVKNSLDKIGVKTQTNDTQLTISGNVTLLNATIKILDNK